MGRLTRIRPEFVDSAPRILEPGVVYVSMGYRTVLHLCCCGCGNEVVTPLAPDRWHLMFDGEAITLNHSIGNWSFPCQSHYWIKGNKVNWDRLFSAAEIELVRSRDRRAMQRSTVTAQDTMPARPQTPTPRPWLARVRRFLRL